MYNYAQINNNNICDGIQHSKKQANHEKLIPITEYSMDYIGRSYVNGVWGDKLPKPEPTKEEKKRQYIKLIEDAEILGETSEVDRLRQEWKQLKITKGW